MAIPVSVSTRADYSAQGFYPSNTIEQIYNLVLIPSDKFSELNKIMVGSQVQIINQSNKPKFTVVYEADRVVIGGQEYFYFYLNTGIRLKNNVYFEQNNYSLKYKDKIYPLSLIFNNNPECKLLIGLIIIPDIYTYAYNANDTIEIKIENDRFNGKIINIEQSHNNYLPLRFTTLLFLDLQNSIDLLSNINHISTSINDHISCRSLTTKRIKTMGEIRLKTDGVYKIRCSGQEFEFNKDLIIKNLRAGIYQINLLDKDNNLLKINNNGNIVETLNIEIFDSIEKERSMIIEELKQKNICIPQTQQAGLPRLDSVKRKKLA
jgi:hypothetical protein